MADGQTPNYDFILPEVGASRDSWGTKLNDNWTALDDLLEGSGDPATGTFLPLTGGTLSGNLTISPAANSAVLSMRAVAGQTAVLQFQDSAGENRYAVQATDGDFRVGNSAYSSQRFNGQWEFVEALGTPIEAPQFIGSGANASSTTDDIKLLSNANISSEQSISIAAGRDGAGHAVRFDINTQAGEGRDNRILRGWVDNLGFNTDNHFTAWSGSSLLRILHGGSAAYFDNTVGEIAMRFGETPVTRYLFEDNTNLTTGLSVVTRNMGDARYTQQSGSRGTIGSSGDQGWDINGLQLNSWGRDSTLSGTGKTVTFPMEYQTIPCVVASVVNTGDRGVWIESVTATGFVVHGFRTSDGSDSVAPAFTWQAMGRARDEDLPFALEDDVTIQPSDEG